MRVIERTIEHPEDEGVILEYSNHIDIQKNIR